MKVSKIKIGESPERNQVSGGVNLNIKNIIKKTVDEIGGFRKFVKPGDVVLLKPNFNSADPYPASSDPEFLRAVVESVYDCGAKLAVIGIGIAR